jgi:hypothetical protein
MKRLSGRLPSPIAAVVAMVVFLATGCATGQSVPSGAAALPTSPVGGPTLTPTVRPSQSDTAVGPSAKPSPTPTPLLWTQASVKEDWPGPVRPEPAGGAIVVPLLVKHKISGTNCPRDCVTIRTGGRHIDRSGDNGSNEFPWVDIQEASGGDYVVGFSLAKVPPDVDPTEQWIAYGVVFDDDRDGVPDRRVGKDNTPETVAGWDHYRTWITDLHTGRTAPQGRDPDYVGETRLSAYFHGDFRFGGDKTGGGRTGMSLVHRPFYVWASVIQNGRVVATDYAPDVGWIDVSLETTRVP